MPSRHDLLVPQMTATNKQKLELTWIRKENPVLLEPHVRIELTDDPQQEDSAARCHEAILAICPEPRCACFDIRFHWLPPSANALAVAGPPAPEFWLSLKTKTVFRTPELEKEPESLRLAEILRAELTDADLLQLREWFLATKLAVIQTTPPSEMDITNLPYADGGLMVRFVEVFPFGSALNFTWNGEAWAVDEQYCVQPGCECKEMVLSFLRLMDAAGRNIASIKCPPALYYNYHTQRAKPVARGQEGSPPLDSLLAALKREHESLNRQLETRHLILQSLYARHFLAQTSKGLQSPFANPVSAVSHKIGRNEPCPCGSGRKYKQCCLGKSGE